MTSRWWIALTMLCMLRMASANEVGRCECAAFGVAGDAIPEGMEPILAQNPLNVTCDQEAAATCERLCIELVKVGKEKAPELLCSHQRHSEGLQPSLWSRTCGGAWKYSGLTCDRKICCHNGKPVPCKER